MINSIEIKWSKVSNTDTPICAAPNFYTAGKIQNNVGNVLRMRQSSVSSISSSTKIKLMRYVP